MRLINVPQVIAILFIFILGACKTMDQKKAPGKFSGSDKSEALNEDWISADQISKDLKEYIYGQKHNDFFPSKIPKKWKNYHWENQTLYLGNWVVSCGHGPKPTPMLRSKVSGKSVYLQTPAGSVVKGSKHRIAASIYYIDDPKENNLWRYNQRTPQPKKKYYIIYMIYQKGKLVKCFGDWVPVGTVPIQKTEGSKKAVK